MKDMEKAQVLTKDQIEVRVGQNLGKQPIGVTLLPYMKSEVIRAILNEKFGDYGWSCEYSRGNSNCKITAVLPDGSKIVREGTGTFAETDRLDMKKFAELAAYPDYVPTKGLATDAFKRAASMFGIGDPLKSIGVLRAYYNDYNGNPQIALYDGKVSAFGNDFTVDDLEIDPATGKITYIEIGNDFDPDGKGNPVHKTICKKGKKAGSGQQSDTKAQKSTKAASKPAEKPVEKPAQPVETAAPAAKPARSFEELMAAARAKQITTGACAGKTVGDVYDTDKNAFANLLNSPEPGIAGTAKWLMANAQ